MIEFDCAIKELPHDTTLSAAGFEDGPKIDPLRLIFTYDSDEWETFVDEWVHSLKEIYADVVRPTGSGDKGIDVAGFMDADCFLGDWDNYQCKHYARPLGFTDIAPEIGKILWYSFCGDYKAPKACFFIAPKGTTPTLDLLLGNASKLKGKVIEGWEKSISKRVTDKQVIELVGDFSKYVNNFDFRVFKAPAARKVIEQHGKTRYHQRRFGGGLPPRPKSEKPPEEVEAHERNYVDRLLEAYADHAGEAQISLSEITKWKPLNDHLKRSREAFFHAESLRVFVRDKTEPGTFESLQDEIHDGVADTHDKSHPDGYARVVAVTDMAQTLALDAHPLNRAARPADRRGVCHQLANDGRLTWKK